MACWKIAHFIRWFWIKTSRIFQLAMFDYRKVIARFKKNLPGVLTQEMLWQAFKAEAIGRHVFLLSPSVLPKHWATPFGHHNCVSRVAGLGLGRHPWCRCYHIERDCMVRGHIRHYEWLLYIQIQICLLLSQYVRIIFHEFSMHLIASSSAWVPDQCVTWLPNPSTGTEAEWNPRTPSAVGWPSWIIYVHNIYIYI